MEGVGRSPGRRCWRVRRGVVVIFPSGEVGDSFSRSQVLNELDGSSFTVRALSHHGTPGGAVFNGSSFTRDEGLTVWGVFVAVVGSLFTSSCTVSSHQILFRTQSRGMFIALNPRANTARPVG